jgi:hypothetical protein
MAYQQQYVIGQQMQQHQVSDKAIKDRKTEMKFSVFVLIPITYLTNFGTL